MLPVLFVLESKVKFLGLSSDWETTYRLCKTACKSHGLAFSEKHTRCFSDTITCEVRVAPDKLSKVTTSAYVHTPQGKSNARKNTNTAPVSVLRTVGSGRKSEVLAKGRKTR